MRADVHRNLNKDTYSIRSREPEDYGRVRSHDDHVLLNSMTFTVQPAGHEKAKENEERNVHAFARGVVEKTGEEALEVFETLLGWREVTYHPFERDHFFYTDTENRAGNADLVYLGPDGCFALTIADHIFS